MFGRDRYIFPGDGKPRLPEDALRLAEQINGTVEFTVHGFRATFRVWAAKKLLSTRMGRGSHRAQEPK